MLSIVIFTRRCQVCTVVMIPPSHLGHLPKVQHIVPFPVVKPRSLTVHVRPDRVAGRAAALTQCCDTWDCQRKAPTAEVDKHSINPSSSRLKLDLLAFAPGRRTAFPRPV